MDIESRLKSLYEPIVYPAGNTHEAEWVGNYLGVSTLVKKTAEQYAQRILAQEEDDRDPTDSYWGFLGNSLCDAALAPVTPYREVQFKLPLSGGWELVGHADGVTIVDGRVIVNEGKAYGTIDSEDKNDLAHRQAALYLAMCEQMLNGGPRFEIVFNVADFATDAGIKKLYLSQDNRLWGTCLHVFPRFGPPALVEPREVPASKRAQILDFYTRKAEAILASVRAGNLDAARMWDRSSEGSLEFAGPMDVALDIESVWSRDEVEAATKFAESKSLTQQAEAVRLTDDGVDTQAILLELMRQAGKKEVALPDGRIIRQWGGWDGYSRPHLRVIAPKEVAAE